jgi:hypothetical protein
MFAFIDTFWATFMGLWLNKGELSSLTAGEVLSVVADATVGVEATAALLALVLPVLIVIIAFSFIIREMYERR